MTLTVKGGWLAGNAIRRARKTYRCQYWRGLSNGGLCGKDIERGDLYVEGEASLEIGRNGTALQSKYCIKCAGPEAMASIPKCKAD